MKPIKKLLAISLCLLLVVFLASCGYSKSDLEEAKLNGYRSGYDDGRKSGYTAGYNEGKKAGYDTGYDEGRKAGYQTGYDTGYNDGYDYGLWSPTPIDMPATGTILSGYEYYYQSEITVKASFGSSYVVSLKYIDGTECVSFFVRSGETATIGVPSMYLYVYFASGDTWYGYGEGLMFGDDTVYSKDDEPCNFGEGSWSYTLYPVYNGNFTETPIDGNEFFG